MRERMAVPHAHAIQAGGNMLMVRHAEEDALLLSMYGLLACGMHHAPCAHQGLTGVKVSRIVVEKLHPSWHHRGKTHKS